MAFRLKMNSLVYIHPDNEFFAQDTDSKVPIALGTNEFITVSHDVTHSLPRNTMEGVIQKTSCSDDFIYDNCVRGVSVILYNRDAARVKNPGGPVVMRRLLICQNLGGQRPPPPASHLAACLYNTTTLGQP